jgi:hypothetical protein
VCRFNYRGERHVALFGELATRFVFGRVAFGAVGEECDFARDWAKIGFDRTFLAG